MKSRLLGAACAGIFSFLSTAAPAALVDNGGGLIYDDVLDITWSQPDAFRTWDNANTWAAGLTLGGVTGWRQPYISVSAGVGPLLDRVDIVNCRRTDLCSDNEMSYMFYQNLGGTYGQPILDSGDPDLALFPSLVSLAYWTDTQAGTDFPGDIASWEFNFYTGRYVVSNVTNLHYVWAVHDGNIGAVPLPPALYLFGTGLIGLVGIAKRKAA